MMTRLLSTIAVIGATLHPVETMAKVSLPSNVTTRSFNGGGSQAVDTIDYSFSADRLVEFSRVKSCIASNITNNEVQLSDSAGSFVGAYTGNYYRTRNSATVQGGGIFKYIDDTSKNLVAHGSISRQGGFGGIISLSIRFDLEMAVEGTSVRMRMLHIEEAMKDTGSATNDGFRPIGVWTGSMYKKDIEALGSVADQLKSCIVS
jgi:hypothetical protein